MSKTTGYKEIENIIKEEYFKSLIEEEKINYLLSALNKFLLKRAEEERITFMMEHDLKSIISGLNAVMFDSNKRKKFNLRIILAILTVIGNIQENNITFQALNSKNLKSPMYTYYHDKLIEIKCSYKLDYLEIIYYLINYLENYQEKTLCLKKTRKIVYKL